jgi:hypothetical protein
MSTGPLPADGHTPEGQIWPENDPLIVMRPGRPPSDTQDGGNCAQRCFHRLVLVISKHPWNFAVHHHTVTAPVASMALPAAA